MESGDIVKNALEAQAIDGLRQKIGGAAADGFESGFQGVFRGDHDDIYAGIAAEHGVEECIGVRTGKMDVGDEQAAGAGLHQGKGFFRVGSCSAS